MKKIPSYLFVSLFIINFVFTSSFQDLNIFDIPSAHAFPGSGDTDGDGVLDINDLDADNDGILDINDCSASVIEPFNGPNWSSSIALTGNNQFLADEGVPVGFTYTDPGTGSLLELTVTNTQRDTAGLGSDFNPYGLIILANGSFGVGDAINDGAGRSPEAGYDELNGNECIEFETNTELQIDGYEASGFAFRNDRQQWSVFADGSQLSTQTVGPGNSNTFDEPIIVPANGTLEICGVNIASNAFMAPGHTMPAIGDGNFLSFQAGFCQDTDSDGIADSRDLDSDNDGIADIYELGDETIAAFDVDGNGTIDVSDGFVDDGALLNSAANNGVDDRIENSFGGVDAITNPINTDSDTIPDFLDLDSDDDGIPDATEARASADYIPYPNVIDTNADSDDDGILDIYDNDSNNPPGIGTFGSSLVGFKTFVNPPNDDSDDSDGIADYVDADSDGDGVLDSQESGIVTDVSFADPDGNVNDPIASGVLVEEDNNLSDIDFRSLAVETPLVIDLDTPSVIITETNQAAFPVSGTCNDDNDEIRIFINDTDLTPTPTPVCIEGSFAFDIDTSSIANEGALVLMATIMDDEEVFSSASDSEIVVRDTVAPITTVSVDTLTNGPDNPTLTLSSIETNSGFDRYEIEYIQDDGVSTTVSSTPTIDTITDMVISLDLDPDELVHTIIVRTFDEAGNVSEVTTILPPVINFTEGTQISNTTIDDIIFTVDTPTDEPLTNIDISGPGSVGAILECQGSDGGTTDPFDDVAVCTISNVTNSGSIIVNAEDSSNGAIGQNQNTYIIDTVVPLVSFIDDVEAGPVMSDTITITASDVNLDTATLVYGFSPDAQCDETDVFDQTFMSGGTIEFNDESNNGQFLCAMVTDLAGNTTFQSSAEALNIDVTAPIVTIDDLVDVVFNTDQTNYIVTGTCTEGDNDVSIEVNNALPETQLVSCDPGGVWTATVDVSPIAEGNGTIVVNATQSDQAGNIQDAVSVNANKDTEPPISPESNSLERSSSRNGSRRRVPPQVTNNTDTLAENPDSQSLLEKMLNNLTQAQRDLIQKITAAKNVIGINNTVNINPISLDRPIEFPDGSCAYFTQHMRKGDQDGKIGREKQELGVPNTIEEIAYLQTVLIQQGFNPGLIDGVFGSQTEAAVSAWQVEHFDAVLAPWNLSGPTGRFYQSSERWMNEILGCPDTVQLDNGIFLDSRSN